MKKTIITGFIILITMNLDAQSCQDILKFDGSVALFEKRIEYTFDSVKEEFVNGKSIQTRAIILLKNNKIELDNKNYEILEKDVESVFDKTYNMQFDYIKYNCIDNDGEEYIIEITKSNETLYSAALYTWITDKKVNKVLYKH